MWIRLDKLLSDSGCGSRSEVRRTIRGGRVKVDGEAVLDTGRRVDTGCQSVAVDGRAVDCSPFHYLMLHKPEGVVSATEDPSLPTVLSLLPPRYQRIGLFPVGRLDRDATGLLLLTNDGSFAHEMTAPGKEIPRIYEATADIPIKPAMPKAFALGLTLPDGTVLKKAILAPDSLNPLRARVTIFEGKYHQVKRMFAVFGLTVVKLKRLSHGLLELDPGLAPGAWRPLSDAERSLIHTDSTQFICKHYTKSANNLC